MNFAASKLLCESIRSCILTTTRLSSGSIKDAGGKWAEMQAAHEGEYFYKRNKEMLEYIKEEIKKGRSIDDIIQETKDELEKKRRRRDHEEEHEDED